jgi:hypothetical protein
MARLHGITKSAVSQAVRKLIRRGPVHDYETSENRKEVLFRLSDRGIEAFTAHNAFHDTFERHYVEELAGYTEEEARGVEKAVEMLLPRAQAVYRQEEVWMKRPKEKGNGKGRSGSGQDLPDRFSHDPFDAR